MVNTIEFTTEVVGLFEALSGKSWVTFGTALGKMLGKVPAKNPSMELPTNNLCPPTWWKCITEKQSLGEFIYYIIEGMELQLGITQQMVQAIADLNDVSKLYKFYNLAARTNFNGGFNSTEMKDAFSNFYEAIKALTDARVSGSTETSAIAKFKAVIQSISAPVIITTANGTTVNGLYVWDDFNTISLELTRGNLKEAGLAAGRFMSALSKPPQEVVDGPKDEYVQPIEYATNHSREFLVVLVAGYTGNSNRLDYVDKILDCAGDIKDLLKGSAQTISALQSGKWPQALYQGIKALCGVSKVTNSCQDSFDLPEEIDQICDVLDNWPKYTLDAAKYLFSVAEKNLFPSFVKAANLINQGVTSGINDFLEDAAKELSTCFLDLLGAILGGPALVLSAAIVVAFS